MTEPTAAEVEKVVTYVSRYGGFCRDCADENGICPTKGLPCYDPRDKAIRHVLDAIRYGVGHGYLDAAAILPANTPPPPDNGLLKRLEALLAAATPGPWDVWRERTDTRDDAVAELVSQVEHTEHFAGAVFLLNANGKCPALTGCGPTSEANAALITEAVNALPVLIATIRSQASAAKPTRDFGEGRFAEWSTESLAAQCLMQARENLDPDYVQFMEAVAARLRDTATIHDELTLAERPMTKADVDRLVDERDALRARAARLETALNDIRYESNRTTGHWQHLRRVVYNAAKSALDGELPDPVESALAQLARAREALEKIADGDEPRPEGKKWREDGAYSKNDQCEHGVWMYETCGNCVSLFAREALASLSPGEENA